MKKIKKLLAMIMAMTMVLGMAMTVSAAPDDDPTTSNITVSGLAAEDSATTVNLYAVITWDETNSAWTIADWAEDYIDTSSDPYTIREGMADDLVEAVQGTPIEQQLTAGETEVTFENVPVGAYVITASGTSAEYSPMVVETYDESATYLTAKDETVVAKTEGYTVTKKQKVEEDGNVFVGRGETVTFEVTTTFPSFEDPDAPDNSYKIVDTPTGLEIQGVVSVFIGGTEIEGIEGAYDPGKTQYTIDLSREIGNSNENAGKRVVITYTAIVTSDEGYNNTANAFRDEQDLGTGEERGYTGSLKVTKYAEDGRTTLTGAEFQVYHDTKANVEAGSVEALWFVPVTEGVYKKALNASEVGATQTIVVGPDGTVTVKGLDEGDYWFKETKAPKGYSINAAGVSCTIDLTGWNEESGNITRDDLSLTDTKLASLPSTGGIGTTIFTIGGCAIMIAAAALYFVNRRKSEEN